MPNRPYSLVRRVQSRLVDSLNARAYQLRELDTNQALRLAQQAYNYATAANDQRGIIKSLSNLSHCNNWLSNIPTALAQGLDALQRMEVHDKNHPARADIFLCLSRCHLGLANFSESVDFARRAQKAAQDTGDTITEADALNVIGINYERYKELEGTLAVFEQALKIHRSCDNVLGIGKVLANLSHVYSRMGQHDVALASGHEGLAVLRGSGHSVIEGYLLRAIGHAHLAKASYPEAMSYFEQAIEIGQTLGNQNLELISIHSIGQVYMDWKQDELAIAAIRRALALAEVMDHTYHLFRCHRMLSQMYEQRKEWEAAFIHHKQFYTMKEAVFGRMEVQRFQSLEIMHQIDIARKEAEVYQLRNMELEQEIAERQRLQEELLHQATTDVLTNSINRRHFMTVANTELERAKRYHHPLSLVLIDLDNLKHINDVHGHAVGDQALVMLATLFQDNIRASDIFARLGGDEFVLLLPETDGQHAYDSVERLRQIMQKQRVQVDGSTVSVSISLGVAALLNEHESLDGLMARADHALYRAKSTGRDCVMLEPA